METRKPSEWGSGEESLLGGAIIRHGTEDWNLISVVLRPKIASTYTVTPQICKCKYEELQQRYSKTETTALYEEIRNTRIVELKKLLEESEDSISWSSWDEVLLGGAIDRHGFQDWNLIASEIQNQQTDSPYNTFTPKACRAKYENLKQRYSETDTKALYEKLKKTRMVELKKYLKQSEDSIGCILQKLEFLKAEKDEKKVDYENGSRNPLSHAPSQKVERIESSTETETTTTTNSSIFSGVCKKRRGKRKRKDYNMNEASVEDSADDDVDSWWKKSSTCTSKRGEVAKSSYAPVYHRNRSLKKYGYEDMDEMLGYLWIGGREWSGVELETQEKIKGVGRPKQNQIHETVGAKSLSKEKKPIGRKLVDQKCMEMQKEALTVKKKVGRPKMYGDANLGQRPSTPMKGKEKEKG